MVQFFVILLFLSGCASSGYNPKHIVSDAPIEEGFRFEEDDPNKN